MKIRFQKFLDNDNLYDVSSIIYDVNSDGLEDVLKEFALFLRGCGYSLPDIDYPIVVAEDEDEQSN